jgi:hypothetical protein
MHALFDKGLHWKEQDNSSSKQIGVAWPMGRGVAPGHTGITRTADKPLLTRHLSCFGVCLVSSKQMWKLSPQSKRWQYLMYSRTTITTS